jgi:hypothetical protein
MVRPATGTQKERDDAMRVHSAGLPATLYLPVVACHAQQRPEEIPLQIPHPHYVPFGESIVVNGPVEQVWARIRSFCGITGSLTNFEQQE